jgi:TolA-binding protein
MRSLNISRRLENTLQRNIQTINTNSINELQQVETKINKLIQDIQGVNRILKVQERQINCVEYRVFELSNKRSHHRSLSSTSVNSGSNIEYKSSSTVINDNNIGSIFFLDPHV